MSSFGKFVTSVTSKFGVISRKAAVRLATETGMAIVDEGARLGRKLTVDEMHSVMKATLPKRCCPNLLHTREEVAQQLANAGFGDIQKARQAANNPNLMGGCVGNGSKKTTIFVQTHPLLPAQYEYSKFAHELEHALETNNRLKGIWMRKTAPLRMLFLKFRMGTKNFQELQQLGQASSSRFQVELQKAHNTVLGQGNPVLSGFPSSESLMQLNGKTEGRYFAGIRNVLNQFANGKVKGSENNRLLSHLRKVMDSEIPAYTVDGKVLEYAQCLKAGQYSVSTGTAVLYRDAQKVIRQEQKLYWFNKFFGKLRKPTIFHTQKDLINLARNKEERKILESIAKNMSTDNQKMLFTTLKSKPNSLANIKVFRDATMVNGKSLYDDSLNAIMDLDPKLLDNPDFVKLMRLQAPTFGYPAYGDSLQELAKTSPEKLKQFASIADEVVMMGDDAILKYQCLARHIEHPQFNQLKQLVDIKVNGTYPYHYIVEDMPRYLTSKQIDDACKEALEAQKKGSDVVAKIAQQIDEAAMAKLSIKRTEAPGIDISDLKVKSL